MVKVFYGKKGSGKTKLLVETANRIVGEAKGNVVFIDYSNQLMCDLDHRIRFINVSEFPVTSEDAFIGCISGILSSNYDLEALIIDGLTYLVKKDASQLENLLVHLDDLSSKYGPDFYISISGETNLMPEFLQKYI